MARPQPAAPVDTGEIIDDTPLDEPQPPRSHWLLGDLLSANGVLPEQCTTYVYRVDVSGRKVPPGFDGVAYSLKYSGVPDFETIREQLGGGFFNIAVTGKNGKMVHTGNVEIEGHARVPGEAPPPAAAPPPSPSPELSVLAPVLERLVTRLDSLESRIAAPPAPAVDQFEMFAKTLALVQQIQPAREPSGTAMVTAYVEALQRGMDIGRAAEGGRTVGDSLIELGPQILQAIQPMLARPAAPPMRPAVPTAGRAAIAAPAVSGASVEPAAAPVPVPPAAVLPMGSTPQERIQWVVAFLAAQRTFGVDPDEAADVLEPRLSDVELAMLRSLTVDQAYAQLGEGIAQFPVLVSEDGKAWVSGVLDRLREPDSDDETDATS